MTRAGKYLISRQVALFFGMLAVIALPVIVVAGFSYASGVAYFFYHFSMVMGVALVGSLAFSFSVFLRPSQNITKPEQLTFRELFPGAIGFILVIFFMILFYNGFIQPRLSSPAVKQVFQKSKKQNGHDNKRLKMVGYKKPDARVLYRGIDLFYTGYYRSSVAVLQKIVHDFPDNYFAQTYLRYARIKASQVQRMKRPIKAASKLLRRGLSLMQQKKYLQAVDLFAKILARYPQHRLALKYSKYAQQALQKKDTPLKKMDKHKGLAVRIELALGRAVAFYNRKLFWKAYVALRDLLLLDPFNKVALDYNKRCKKQILRFDFFYDEFTSLYLYPYRENLLLTLGGGWYLFARRMYRKYNRWYARRIVLIYSSAGDFPDKLLYAEYGKWIDGKLTMRGVRSFFIAQGQLAAKDRSYYVAPIAMDPARLWSGNRLLSTGASFSLNAVLDMLSDSKSAGVPLGRVRVAFIEIFVVPAAVLCLALFVLGGAWKYRSQTKTIRKWVVALFFVLILPCFWLVLVVVGRVFLAGALAFADSALFSYLTPLALFLVCVFLLFFRLPLKMKKNQ